MPKRKRHYIYCKAGLHLLSQTGVIKVLKKASLIRGRYVIRYCRVCRDVKNEQYYKRLTGPRHLKPKRQAYTKAYMKKYIKNYMRKWRAAQRRKRLSR